jgi:NADH-quinone oxidoreductase chain G
MTEQMVTLTIDDQQVEAPAGSTVVEAATSAGIHIPTFCHHESLVPVGACRMCLVEIVGVRGLQTACTTPVREGMIVAVHTSRAAVEARRAQIEFLLTNHPLDCPVCDKGGECLLQDQALLDGPSKSRYVEEKRHKKKQHPLSALIMLDQERCVLCRRCVRFLDEWADDHELDLFGRGADTCIDTFAGRPLGSKWQGNTIDLCPVGALTSRVFRFEARVWELTETPSLCPLCGVGCNLVLGVKNNRIRRITPRENPKVNLTWLCDRGRFAHQWVGHPDRLQQPLVRREQGLQPTTWEDALHRIASQLDAVVAEHGGEAVGGIGSTRATNEANYLFQRFMRSVVGTNHVDHFGRQREGTLPLPDLAGLEHKDVFLLAGLDPSADAPLVELWIKRALLRHGAQVITAGARQIELQRYGGPWMACRPGAEVALLHGLARVILDEGLESPKIRVTNVAEFKESLRAFDAARVERWTGVSWARVREAARLLAGAKAPALLVSRCWTRGDGGQAVFNALVNLGMLLGGVEPACLAGDNNMLGALEMGVAPHLYPGLQPLSDRRVRDRLGNFWRSKLPMEPGLVLANMLEAALDRQLRAMWIMGSDPVCDYRIGGAALGRLEFLVVQDLFLTDTARMADVVLPAASFGGVDGSTMNLTGRVQRLQAGYRPPGEARPDWWVVCELARRMVDRKQAEVWQFGSASDVFAEIARAVPAFRGLTLDSLGDHGWQRPAPPAPSRRAFLPVSWQPPVRDPEYPLSLVTGRVLYDRGTLLGHSARVQCLVPEAYVVVHPQDAAAAGIRDGAEVTVASAEGRLLLRTRVSDEVMPGCVFVPHNLGEAPVSAMLEKAWLTDVQLVS